MHQFKADAQRQTRSLQSQLQTKQEQISLLESELADSVAQAEHEMSPAEQNLSQAADLKSELEAAQQLSLSHQGHGESSRRQIRSMHSHLPVLQHQRDDLRQQLADAQSARQQVLHSLYASKREYRSCNISSALHSTACSSSQGGSSHVAQAD
ncbi:hypothetical protein ABBQ38_008574 [Trebouxia sp. C0009 RCD-2024]